jgi:hypothetical protein
MLSEPSITGSVPCRHCRCSRDWAVIVRIVDWCGLSNRKGHAAPIIYDLLRVLESASHCACGCQVQVRLANMFTWLEWNPGSMHIVEAANSQPSRLRTCWRTRPTPAPITSVAHYQATLRAFARLLSTICVESCQSRIRPKAEGAPGSNPLFESLANVRKSGLGNRRTGSPAQSPLSARCGACALDL